jgi:transcriptional regulator GlxA family with amidase domain
VNRLFVDHVTLAVVAHLSQAFGGVKLRERATYGGLAPWQERRIKEFLDANLDGDVSVALLANECGLSVNHFSRAFHQSIGMPPHQWLLRSRVDKARQLLRDPALALVDVALACGFTDQSHLTRVFTRLSGTSPGAWRRAIR